MSSDRGAVQNNDVRIITWPENQAAQLEHRFNSERPCPVQVGFTDSSARVLVQSPPEQSVNINMAMNVSAKQAIPVCIVLCNPICAESNYEIGIVIFDRPVASITLRGRTRLFNCDDQA